MKQAYILPLKRIIAGEPQALINLKLYYNSLIEKFNTSELPESEKEQLLKQLKELDAELSTHS